MKCVLKHLGLAAISLACSIGFAQAQARPDAAALLTQIPPHPPAPPGVTVGGGGFIRNPNGPSPAIVNGTNYRHCYEALWYTPNQTEFYIFGYNTEGDYVYYYVNSPFLTSPQSLLKEICLAGRAYYAYQQTVGPYFINEIWQNNGN